MTDEELMQFWPEIKDSELPAALVAVDAGHKLDRLKRKLKTSKISQEDYHHQRDVLLRLLVMKDIARADKIWEKQQAYFLHQRPYYLPGCLKGDAMFCALGAAVKSVSNDPKFANATGMAILVEADKAVRSLFNIGHIEGSIGKWAHDGTHLERAL